MKKILMLMMLIVLLVYNATADEAWICSSCGIEATGNFCSNCGQSKTETIIDKKVQLYLDVKFESNLLFNTYDVDLYIGDSYITTIPHGKRFTKLISVSAGEIKIVFYKSHDKQVQGSDNYVIVNNSTYSCTVHAYSDYIDISSSIYSGVEGASITMPDMDGYVLADAINVLKERGFVNISSYVENDSIWDENNWIVVQQNIDPGTGIDKNEHIILTCCKKEQILRDSLQI